MNRALLISALILAAGWSPDIGAHPVADHMDVSGYVQSWWTVVEQMEDVRGLYQHPSGDEATDLTSGFSLARARVLWDGRFLDGLLNAKFQLKLESNPQVLDLVLDVRPGAGFSLFFGQTKIPGPYENLQDNRELDFLLRSDTALAIADYSLSRTTHASSLFSGNRSYLRDFGAGIRGDWQWCGRPVHLFFMVGNGLGAGLFIGGQTHREFIITNRFQFFTGLRLQTEPWPEVIVLGGHINYNEHDNIVFNSGRTVYDLHRVSYSGDLQIRIPHTGLRLIGGWGSGKNLEDFDDNDRVDFTYTGWQASLLWSLNPLLARLLPSTWWQSHLWELGVRYEDFATRSDEAPEQTHLRTLTAGVTCACPPHIRIQLNALMRRTDAPFEPDLADDALILNVQFTI